MMIELKETYKSLLDKTDKDICTIYDTGFFNEITRAYMHKAMIDADIPKEQIQDALFHLNILHNISDAERITEHYKKEIKYNTY